MQNKAYSFIAGTTDEDIVLLDRVSDRVRLAEDKYETGYTAFLDERQAAVCETLLKSLKYECYKFYGGYDGALRKMLCIFPPYTENSVENFPLEAVTFTYRKEDKLSHRDFLGSLMSFGISRDSVGDILVSEGKAVAFLRNIFAKQIVNEIKCVGKIGVKCNEGFGLDDLPKSEFVEIKGTVASMRADCIVSLALHISREKAAEIIKKSGAEINHVVRYLPRYAVMEKDEFSVRGHGKFIVSSVDGTTKKDRIHLTVLKYV